MADFGDIRIAFGESDEYSFALHKSCDLFGAFGPLSVHVLMESVGRSVLRFASIVRSKVIEARVLDYFVVLCHIRQILARLLSWHRAEEHAYVRWQSHLLPKRRRSSRLFCLAAS